MMKRCVWLAAAAVFLFGCGAGTKIVPVSGIVTLDGKPLANAHVAFQPATSGGKSIVGVGSYGNTDADGKYTLKVADSDQPGAVVGKHRVEINLRVESDDRDPKTRPPPKTLPVKYNRQSELQFEVKPGGASEANFDLKSR
jgi:hypothetical protein